MGYTASTTIEGRIQQVESKVDLALILLRDLLEFQISAESSKSSIQERIKRNMAGVVELVKQPGVSQYSGELESAAKRSAAVGESLSSGITVFELNVGRDGKVHYADEKWDYRVGSRVQWVSKSGNFTVHVDLLDYPRSPFEGLEEIQATWDENTQRWKTPVINVESPFTPAEKAVRRRTGARPARHTFTVALSRGDRIVVDRTKNGYGC